MVVNFLKRRQMKLLAKIYKKVLKKNPPYYLNYPIILIIWKPIRKFINVVIIPNIPFNFLRVWLYRLIGFKIGKNVFIGMKCYLDDVEPQNIIIGNNVTISYGCYFACHGINQKRTKIIIEDNVYIGMRCNIVSGKNGIRIKQGAIIGAASLVNKDVEKDDIVAGVPIRKIK